MGAPSARTLVNCIPVAAPATRRPPREGEPAVGVSLGFLPQWYCRRLNVRFGEIWHTDCEYRYETLARMKALLRERFPSVEAFAPRDNGHGCDADCATLSGVYGSKLLAMLYGFEVAFPETDWPGDRTGRPLPREALARMKPIDLDESPVIRALDEQMDAIERAYGRIDGYLNYQGVLNTALKLRGNEIFVDMLEDEPFADDLLAHIADTLRRVAMRVQARQRRSGADIDLMSLSNCVVNMVSPAMYERFVLPRDLELSRAFQRFGIHTCNWNVTPYLRSIRNIPDVGYLDMGAMSDMALARRMFPEARLAVLISPLQAQNAPLDALEAEFRRIAAQAAPCDIVLADLTETIEDSRVRDILSIIYRIREEYE